MERDILDRYSTPSLRRNTLTEEAKRWQLWGKGVRGEEADRIIDQLYPKPKDHAETEK